VVHLGILVILVPIILFICVFSFVSVAAWSDARRREREAFYKSETIKKIAETPGEAAISALEYLREQEKIATQRRHEGLALGGLVSAATGIGLLIFLYALIPNKAICLVGLIPLFVGLALLAYSYFLAPKEARASS
jgi:hypothetical protein